MAEKESSDEISASSTEPRWPDPSRPIVYEQPGYGAPGYQQGAGAQPPTMAPRVEPLRPGDEYRTMPPPVPPEPDGPRLRTVLAIALMVLAAVLVSVWFLWWR